MFLFDKHRTSQQKAVAGNTLGRIRWKTYLNTFPPFCAESTAVLDQDGNFYFGSHSGNFYSLSSEGNIRWTFTTKHKIYGSPILVNNTVYFAGGDGNFYALSARDGSIKWIKNLQSGYNDNKKSRLFNFLMHVPYTFNFKRKMYMNTKSWSSPNFSNDIIYITAYGKGLYAFDTIGNEVWSYNLGYPRYQLSGVVLDENDNVYLSSRKGDIYCFSFSGCLIWKEKALKGWHGWGNPTYNLATNFIHYTFSKGESRGAIFCVDKKGTLVWNSFLKGAVHGSVAISNDGEYLYCCDFSGYIYKIDAISGKILNFFLLSSASRALWTTPTIDFDGNIYLSTKDSFSSGRIIKLNNNLAEIWEYKTNKTLCVPYILQNGDICFGSWDGYYYCLTTEK